MMNKEKMLEHMIAWAIQTIYNTNKEAQDILENTELPDEEKTLKLRGPQGTDYRLLNLILLLRPVIEAAKESYPDHGNFFEWFNEKWQHIQDSGWVKGICGCKG